MRRTSVVAVGVALVWGGSALYAGCGSETPGGMCGADRCGASREHVERGAFAAAVWPAYTPVAPTGVTIVVPGEETTTIQGAIDRAVPGDTVLVRAGTYFEHLLLNKQLTLMGEDGATVIIDGEGAGTILRVTASGVEIQGFTFQNSGSSPEFEWCAGLQLSSVQGVHVARCRFVNNQIGVYPCNVADSVFERSTFEGNRDGVLTGTDHASPEHSGWFHANSILGNVFRSNGTAICFSHINENDANLVQGNLISGNSGGIHITVSDENEFSYNVIADNTGCGFCIDICMCGAYFNEIHHNIFAGNHGGAVQAYESESFSPSVFNYWYSPDDGVGNYWSDYTGVDVDHDGLGDVAYTFPDARQGDLHPLMHPYLLGDMNLDGDVNVFDIDPFVLALMDSAAYQTQYQQPGDLLGDCNFDGAVDVFDIDPFVYRLTHGDEIAVPPRD